MILVVGSVRSERHELRERDLRDPNNRTARRQDAPVQVRQQWLSTHGKKLISRACRSSVWLRSGVVVGAVVVG